MKNLILVSFWQHGGNTCNSFHMLLCTLLDVKINDTVVSSVQIFSVLPDLSSLSFLVIISSHNTWILLTYGQGKLVET